MIDRRPARLRRSIGVGTDLGPTKKPLMPLSVKIQAKTFTKLLKCIFVVRILFIPEIEDGMAYLYNQVITRGLLDTLGSGDTW